MLKQSKAFLRGEIHKMKSALKTVLNKFRIKVKEPVYIPVMSGNILQGKTVFITGGTGSIGLSIAQRCIENGAKVIIAGRTQRKIDTSLECLDGAIGFVLDIQDTSDNMKKFFLKFIDERKLTIDTLINCAGLQVGTAFGNTKEEDYDKTLDTNLKGTYFFSQIFSNYLIENKVHGNILNISSVSGIRPAVSPYMISKWGITGLTEGMAKKLIPYGIVVNGIAPGPVATKMLGLNGRNLDYSRAPAGRYSDPVEVANLAVFMISNMGRMIVGDTVYITGGCGNLTVDDIKY